MMTDAARAQMAENAERARLSQAEHEAALLAEGVANLRVGDWVATSWQTDGQQRCGYVVALIDADEDAGEPARVEVFEARPRTDRTADGTEIRCELCGHLPGGQWKATAFRVPVSDIVEVKKVTDWHRQTAAQMIVRCLADAAGHWTGRHTRRLRMALALVDGHEATT